MKLNTKLISLAAAGLMAFSCTNVESQPIKNNPQWVKQAMETVEQHTKNMLPRVLESKQTPRSIERGLRPSRDWTSGFYPGTMWYLYEYTQDNFWKENAETVTEFLVEEQYNTDDHDVGFRVYCSYGNGYLLTQNPEYKKVVIQAAKSLSTRFNEKTQTIQSWSARKSRDWKFPVIIDNMMNLELLFEASKLSGDNHFADVSVKHANQTMKYHYREDYSCPHVVDYDPETGEFRRMDWNNGFCDPKVAAWSRGQSWGLYGYTLMFRETKDKKYLDFAEKIAEFLLNHPNMPEDMVPYWDYSCPKIPTMRDASAGAIMGSALLELSTYSKKNGEKYFEAGEKILKSLASENYLAKPGTNGDFAIMHTTGNYMGGSEVNGTLSYADYYFTEGLCRYLKLINNQPLFKD
ncbi:glucuronyl hydrolase [Puteibacter caeruleilacunae]|nr:glucuronyl hydrolase [Puteibacter caeruleilacunae]